MLILLPPLVNSMNSESTKLKVLKKQNTYRATTVTDSQAIKSVSNTIRLIILIYVLLFIWWITIFMRVNQIKDGTRKVIVIFINLIFGPLFGEIALQISRSSQ